MSEGGDAAEQAKKLFGEHAKRLFGDTYNEGFVDGWDYAMAVLRYVGQDVPKDTALMRMKRKKAEGTTP